jgi:hypothetical protein
LGRRRRDLRRKSEDMILANGLIPVARLENEDRCVAVAVVELDPNINLVLNLVNGDDLAKRDRIGLLGEVRISA